MLVSVPQYIDVEDKIAGPLTAKQLGWMFGMGTVLLVCWNIFETGAFWIAAVFVILIFCALAFYRPNGMTLLAFIGSSISFLFRPKVYVWKRVVEKNPPRLSPKEKVVIDQAEIDRQGKKMSAADLSGFAKVLDSEGMNKDERIMELLRQKNLSKK